MTFLCNPFSGRREQESGGFAFSSKLIAADREDPSCESEDGTDEEEGLVSVLSTSERRLFYFFIPFRFPSSLFHCVLWCERILLRQ